MNRSQPYPPIADYALIGNRHTCALVARDGSIDWCCLPHLESPSVFAGILDRHRGGRWRVGPAGESSVARGYVGASAVLDTEFRGAGGVLRVRDFLPIRAGRGDEISRSSHALVRIAECLEGEVEVEVEWEPRPNYARDDVTLSRSGEMLLATSRHGDLWLSGLGPAEGVTVEHAAARAVRRLRAGETMALVSGWGRPDERPPSALAHSHLDETLRWWEGWARSCHVSAEAGRWRDLVLRSGMVLKLLTNERTGAIAAAPTTSLPEEIGGVRNWDYRYCWVRDSSLIIQAFVTLGQREDGIAFLRFLEDAAQQHRDPARVQIMYGLNGERHLPEYNLGHLDGYRDSRPVRIGNAAALQRQLDVYGELLEAAHALLQIGASLPPEQLEWLRGVANYVCHVWRLPDRGIWEVRGPERHFTYSKLMCWVALDRSLRIPGLQASEGDRQRWRRERDAIRAAVLEQGYDAAHNTFVQSFGGRALDASSLLIPLMGFLPPDDPRVLGTLDATRRELLENGLVHRYLPGEAADGVAGGEGAFGICTFWLADALALCGRVDEAQEIFAGMVGRANDVGLFAEEIDPRTGAFLGNFPQAFTHVGLISSTRYIGEALARGGGAAKVEEPAAVDGHTT